MTDYSKMMTKKTIIKTREEAGISYEELVELIHESFKERLCQGLHFSCSSMNVETYKKKSEGGIIFCAIDSETNRLLGTATTHLRKDKYDNVYAYHEYLAVAPSAKRSGIGNLLFLYREKEAYKAGAKYILSDTACKAESSVKWHLKMGFKIYELESYRSTNYWSYVFIKYLDPTFTKKKWQIKLHYLKSYLFIKTTRHINGSDTLLGKLYKKAKKICKNYR